MKKIDIVGISFGNFKRRKTRSILTVLGVVIGTASIVTMMSLGIAMNVSFSNSLQGMGDLTTVNVYPDYDPTTGKPKGDLNDEVIKQLEGIANVTAVSPEINLSGKMVSGKYQCYANIIGIDMKNVDRLGLTAEQGNMLTDKDISTGKNVFCLFGSEVAYQFFNPKSQGGGMIGGMMGDIGGMGGDGEITREPPPVDVMASSTKIRYTYDWSYGETNPGDQTAVKKKPVLFNMHITGLLKKTGGQSDNTVYVDLETAKRLKKEQEKFMNSQNQGGMVGMGGGTTSKQPKSQTYDSIKIIANSMENTIKIAEDIKAIGYQAQSNADWILQSQKQSQLLQLILGGIGSVSLIVAAIGITNTMIMSIYERTREIGIMKVIGCCLKDIRTMFLVEAGFIGLFGGIVGVVLSYGISLVLNFFGGKADLFGMGMMGGMGGAATKLSVIPPWLALLAIVFAILVGLISGFLPARRAMRLSALEAMRT